MGLKPRIETAFERGLFRSRWLMAPFYAGLALALAMLLVVLLRELFYYLLFNSLHFYDKLLYGRNGVQYWIAL